MSSIYTIYNASAGAGKTYTLVKNFLSLLLKNESPEIVRTVLAVTFTNKAANEMKSRVLSWLNIFADPESCMGHVAFQQIAEEMGMDKKILNERAQKCLSYILHHYSLLSISTIDKFNLRLMKSFTKELGLSYSFSVELDASEYLKQSIDELIDQLGTDNPVTEVILNYIFWKFENESSTDIRKELLLSSKNFLKELHLEKVNSLTKKDFEDFEKLGKLLRTRIQGYKKDIKEIASEIISLIENNGLEITDFYQGARGIGGFFHKIIKEEHLRSGFVNISCDSAFYKDFCEKEKYAKTKSPREDDIRSIAPRIIESFYQVKKLINRIKIDESVQRNLITIELQSEITNFLEHKKTSNDILFISDVNPIISQHLKEEPIAFIYEKLGGRYNHYFIDEFQDTSQLQWDNFLPLLENARVSHGTSITLVGDPKQAIYRFRSGKPEILIDLISTAKNQNIEVYNLGENYRSLPNIVDFNNKFYYFLSGYQLDNPVYCDLFGEKAQQIPKLKYGGRVQVSFVKPPEKEINFLAGRVLEIVEEALENGFSYKDIAILVRNKKHSFSIVELLGQKGYPILTEEAMLINSSSAVKTIIAAFRWISNPNDKKQLITVLYHLWMLEKISIDDFTEEVCKIKDLSAGEVIEYLKDNFQISFSYRQSHNLSFFDYAEEIIRSLKFGEKEQMYICALLDMILLLEKNGVISLNEFLENWELQSPNLSIRFPDNMNAIQVMTIHKSKGLEFPVVIYPMISGRQKSEEYWFPLEEDLYHGFDKYYASSKAGLEGVNENIAKVVEKREFENNVDELCIQYVATTRASQQLFLVEEAKDDKKQSPLKRFLQTQIEVEKEIVELYPQAEKKKIEHNIQKSNAKEDKIGWCSERWNQKIKISTEIRKFFSEENKYIRYGNAIHSILAEINTKDDLAFALKKSILSGLLEIEHSAPLQKIIFSVLDHPRLKKYFSKDIRVYKEQEILFEGRFYRPDRIVEIEGKFSVIEFKTGEKLSKHRKQIELYSQALKSFGKCIEEKLLVYISQNTIEIIEVHKSNKTPV